MDLAGSRRQRPPSQQHDARGLAGGILVAAGSGERLGHGPKAFVTLGGRPLLTFALEALRGANGVGPIVVVVRAADVEATADLLGAGERAIAGGMTRTASVGAGLAALPRGSEVVAVHDAARPLISSALIDATLQALVPPWVAVAPGLPVVDTLKQVRSGRVKRTADRTDLWMVQTPQVFDRSTLQRVHSEIAAAATDDLALVEAAGGAVRLILGAREGLKITFPEDLALAEALLAGGVQT